MMIKNKKYLFHLLLIIFFVGCQHRVQIKSSQESLKEKLSTPVYFSFGKWALSPQEEKKLFEKISLLKANPAAVVILEGHTDSIGTEENNLELGDRRAGYVRWKLSLEGVNPQNLIVTSVGESQSTKSSLDESVRSVDRRVDFKVK
ncbi:MAG: OmpA family protein [Deltaproteobacteria bacterium]|nr:MAG: OmpA family protein [Deltaproteobacteria bacterium]